MQEINESVWVCLLLNDLLSHYVDQSQATYWNRDDNIRGPKACTSSALVACWKLVRNRLKRRLFFLFSLCSLCNRGKVGRHFKKALIQQVPSLKWTTYSFERSDQSQAKNHYFAAKDYSLWTDTFMSLKFCSKKREMKNALPCKKKKQTSFPQWACAVWTLQCSNETFNFVNWAKWSYLVQTV